jgi:hypothetical protein
VGDGYVANGRTRFAEEIIRVPALPGRLTVAPHEVRVNLSRRPSGTAFRSEG